MLAYRLSIQDNDSYAFREYPPLTRDQRLTQRLTPDISGTPHPNVRRCEACGELLAKWGEPLRGLVIKKRRYDLGVTYDGIPIVSQRFKAAYEASSLSGLLFRQLPDDKDFFSIQATRIVEFDSERRKTRFIDKCPTCGHFKEVIGATPVFLRPGTVVGPKEIVRTDLEFGSLDGKHPMLICGEEAAESLKSAKLKGLALVLIEDHGPA